MSLDVIGKTVDVVVHGTTGVVAGRQAQPGSQSVEESAAQRRVIEEAMHVAAADQAGGGLADCQ